MTRIPICPSTEAVFPGQLITIPYADVAMEQAIRTSFDEKQLIGIVYVPQHNPHNLCRIGTLARPVGHIQSVGLDTTPLAVVGKARFRMLQLHYENVYPEATIQLWPWAQSPPPVWSTVETLGHYLKRYIDALTNVLPPALMPEGMQPNAATLGVLGAALLQLPPENKQQLLEIPTTRDLVRHVLRYMRIYVPLTEKLAIKAKTANPLPERVNLN